MAASMPAIRALLIHDALDEHTKNTHTQYNYGGSAITGAQEKAKKSPKAPGLIFATIIIRMFLIIRKVADEM